MIQLTPNTLFLLAILTFWSGLCFGFGIHAFIINRRQKKNKKSNLEVVPTAAEIAERRKQEGLWSVNGGKKN